MVASETAITPTQEAPLRLRRGRHKLTREAVSHSQLTRLLDAVGHVVAVKGFKAATVADVIRHARVSRKTFYEHFEDVQGCFLASYTMGMQTLFQRIRHAIQEAETHDWRERTRLAIDAYLKALAGAPELTWSFTIENVGAGKPVLEQRACVLERWVGQWRALQALRESTEPGTTPIADITLLAMVGGIEEVVRDCLHRRGAAAIAELTEPVTQFALAVLEGAVARTRPK